MGQVQRRIVVVDDDPVGIKVVRFLLEDHGYAVSTVARGSQVFQAVTGQETDLVILDINLPDIDGFTLYTELRARQYTGPILFLTSRTDIADRLTGLRLGADDYLAKPYEPQELVARVHSIMRRSRRAETQALETVIRVEDAELSLGTLTYSSAAVPPTILTPVEMRILECLMRNSRIIISRETLIERVWGFEFLGDTNRVDVYIRRVRHKIEADPAMPTYLHTVRGVGYVFRVDPQQTPHRSSDTDEIVPGTAGETRTTNMDLAPVAVPGLFLEAPGGK